MTIFCSDPFAPALLYRLDSDGRCTFVVTRVLQVVPPLVDLHSRPESGLEKRVWSVAKFGEMTAASKEVLALSTQPVAVVINEKLCPPFTLRYRPWAVASSTVPLAGVKLGATAKAEGAAPATNITWMKLAPPLTER